MEASKLHLAEIEQFIVGHYRPYFMSIVDDYGSINILICSSQFNSLNVEERISNVFDLIKRRKPDILNYSVTIEAYTASEMDDILEYL